MRPILFQWGFLTVYTYGVFVAAAFLAATFLASREARRQGVDEDLVSSLGIALLVSGIVSARLFYIGLQWDHFKDNLLEVFKLQHGGLVWFGGLFGAVLAGLVFMRLKKMPVVRTLDLLAPYAALAQGIGRIGCYFNGCCYGKESSWGIYFPLHDRTLLPSQLLDSLTLVLIFVLLRLLPGKERKGQILCLYLVLAALQRFLLEFLRGDIRPFYFSLSIFQWISLGVFFAGLVFYAIFFLWKKKTA